MNELAFYTHVKVANQEIAREKRKAEFEALRLKQYDKAIFYFQALSQQKNLYSNPGKFYEALALMQQHPINKNAVEKLFNDVIDNNLEGNAEARKLVDSYQYQCSYQLSKMPIWN